MRYDLEKKIIGYALVNKEVLDDYPIEKKWFHQKELSQIAEALEKIKSRFSEFQEIESEVKSSYPFTKVTAEALDELQYNAYSVTNYATLVHSLKREYYKRQMIEASSEYAKMPNADNMESLKKATKELDELEDEVKKDGDLNESSEELHYQLENEMEDGIKTFKEFDKILGYGLEGARLIVVAGRPANGKTAWGVSAAINGLEKNETPFIDFFSLEMKQLHMYKRFISNVAQINSYKLKNPKKDLNNDQKAKVIERDKHLKSTNLKIHDDKFYLDDIIAQIKKTHRKAEGKKQLVFIDYLQLIKNKGNFQSRQIEIGHITRSLKQVANVLNIPIIVFAQLGRGAEQKERPTLTDLRESGDIENDSDIVCLLHKDKEEENIIHFEVAKNRDGMIGTIDFNFIKSQMYFEEIEK